MVSEVQAQVGELQRDIGVNALRRQAVQDLQILFGRPIGFRLSADILTQVIEGHVDVSLVQQANHVTA